MRLRGFLLLLPAAALAAWWFLPRALQPLPVETGEARLKVEGRAFFFRSEQVVVAPAAGEVRFLVEDGERVPAGTPIVTYADGDRPWQGLLDQTAAALAELEEAGSSHLEELAARAAEVRAAAASLLKEARERDSYDFRKEAGRLAGALERYQAAHAAGEQARQEAEGLRSRLATLEEVFEPERGQLLAPDAGVVRYGVDPLASRLARWQEEPLRPSDLAAREELRPGRQVRAGEPLFRLGDPWVAYWAVDLPVPAADRLPTGTSLELTLEASEPVNLPAELVGRGPPEGGRVVVILRSDALGSAGTFPLQTPVKLAGPRVPGVLLPRKALTQRNEVAGVYLLPPEGGPRWQPVTLLGPAGADLLVVEGLEEGVRVSGRPWLARLWDAVVN